MPHEELVRRCCWLLLGERGSECRLCGGCEHAGGSQHVVPGPQRSPRAMQGMKSATLGQNPHSNRLMAWKPPDHTRLVLSSAEWKEPRSPTPQLYCDQRSQGAWGPSRRAWWTCS